MFGVILWSDAAAGQAVIWCEDSGNLAYYQAPGRLRHSQCDFFDAGDYVEFEVTQDDRLRRASNAQKVQAEPTCRVQEVLRRGPEFENEQRRVRPIRPVIAASDNAAGQIASDSIISHHG